ncbi:MAG: helix-turn-helix domain-containing protein [Chitinophagaceae bacterium]
MRPNNKLNVRVTIEELNIPLLMNELIGINVSIDENKTETQSSPALNLGETVSHPIESQTSNSNESSNLNEMNANNTNQETTSKRGKLHMITRKDKALFDLFKGHLETDLRYTDHDFSLKIAARELGTNEKYLSSAINNCSGISFNSLVNRYRIAHAKKLIFEDVLTRHNLEEIAYMSGYGNRTTFYRVFTELEGVTPSRFRDNYNKDFTL